jgi:branched-chain amino acid transport system substrate-binding protein
MNIIKTAGALACAAALLGSSAVRAEDNTLKIGIVAPMSGAFASNGKQVENGINAFMKDNGDTVSGQKVSVIYRDTGGASPEGAKRISQELISRDKVDVLGGYVFTQDAMASAAVATAGKKPMFIMMGATSSVTTKSPYIIRTSYTMPQMSLPMGQWAAKNGIKKAFVLVADYGPGHDGATWFEKGFKENGGVVVEEVMVPVSNRDFGPYVQRIKDAKPDAVFVFLPAGEPTVVFMKEYANRGLAKAGIKVLATEGWADDETLAAVGDAAVGVISTGFYTTGRDTAINKKFLTAYKAVSDGKMPPNFIAVAAYDAMQVIYTAMKQQKGKLDPDKLMAAAKGMQFESPRGPFLIDKDTRDIVEDIYVRKVENINGKIVNREFDKFPMVKDPGK